MSSHFFARSSVGPLKYAGGLGAIAAALALTMPAAASAQVTPYVVSVTPGTYVPLTGGTTLNPSSGTTDGGYVQITAPFPIKFFDVPTTNLRVAMDGHIIFNHTMSPTLTNQSVPSSTSPNELLAVWWDDNHCDAANAVQSQELGTAPNRQFVIQYHCRRWGNSTSSFQAQAWFSEGSSTIQVKYGTASDGSGTAFTASMGIENANGTIGYQPFTCGTTCSANANFPTNQVVTYAQGPDMMVASVTGVPVAYAGVMSHMEAVARNAGGEEALGFGLRFLVSQDDRLDANDAVVGMALPATADAQPGQSVTFTLDAPIPATLSPGQYYLIAEVDPLDVVDEDTETNNYAAYGPFEVGLPAPDLIVESITTPTGGTPGETFTLDWTVANIGNLIGTDVPYAVVVSANDVISSSDRRIFNGVVSVEQLTSLDVQEQITLPGDLNLGTYWIGVLIDPDNDVYELNDRNNEGVSASSFTVSVPGLQLLTTTLPPAEIGSLYCVQLRAAGGDGTFTWTVESGTLPVGLAIEEERGGMPDDFPVLATMLCGRPAATGTFGFSLRVQSGDLSAVQDYTLVVNESGMPLVVATKMVPQAQFQVSYEAQLLAVGGKAPYEWNIAGGALPPGMFLATDGKLFGEPVVDGTYPVSVQVTDAAGASATGELVFEVSSPARLTCVSRTLPPSKVGERFQIQLLAAGGTKPYSWSTLESRRLADALTIGQTFLNSAPPGFLLAGDGTVTAEPLAAGKYIWQVEVDDAEGNSPDGCTLSFEVTYDQGLSVATTALAEGFVDTPYRAQLQVGGAAGVVSWSLASGSTLPEGLQLSQDGVISGIVSTFVLEGEASRTFSFVVQVRDVENRANVAPLSITFREAPRDNGVTDAKNEDEGGCSAGATAPGLLGLGIALAALRRRR